MSEILNALKIQLTEQEQTIYRLIKSGMSFRDVGTRLDMDGSTIHRIYGRAVKKLKKQGYEAIVDKYAKKH